MAQVTLPNTIAAGGALDASKVQENFDAIVAAINSIDNTQLAADSVNAAAIVDAVITAAKLADGSVTEDKIAAAAVTTAKVGDNQITDAKLATPVTAPIHESKGPYTITHTATSVASVAGLNTSKWPLWAVYWEDPVAGGGYRQLGSWDSSGNDPTTKPPNGIQVSGRFNGNSFDITMKNDSEATVVLRAICIGEAA